MHGRGLQGLLKLPGPALVLLVFLVPVTAGAVEEPLEAGESLHRKISILEPVEPESTGIATGTAASDADAAKPVSAPAISADSVDSMGPTPEMGGDSIGPDPDDHLPPPFTFRFRGGSSLKIYGKLELLTYYDTTTPFISDWLAFVEPKGTWNGGEDSFSMSVRASPIGMHLNVPDVAGSWALDARIEADFSGGFVTGASSAYSPLMRLKQAWVSMGGKHVSILAGQSFGIFSPVFPDTANWIALGTSGNPWIRLPQIRVSLKYDPVRVDLSVNRPMGSNEVFTDTVNDLISDGEQSNMPFFMGRAGVDLPLSWGRFAGGVSGVFGREKVRRVFDPDKRDWARKANGEYEKRVSGRLVPLEGNLNIWMAGADLLLTTRYVDVMAEFFVGDNLNTFFAGVLQGVSLFVTTLPDGVPSSLEARSIRTIGGWGQVIAKPIPHLTIGLGAGVDDPRDSDLVASDKAPARARNLTVFGNAGYRIGGVWLIGAECSYTQTSYLPAAYTNDNWRVVAKTSWSF